MLVIFIYPDCRQEFRDIDYEAFVAGNWGAEKVKYYTPYIHGINLLSYKMEKNVVNN
jgi:hypothetical protein